ncbi:MAG: nitroreductase family protein [Euryarchaeota archaeon]|nr:nitroreductase family protein [Euryarchaeota archaeon]MBT4391749.1 nitroreductase family protein [Euryarchaeota archaeon]MBT4802105.1 nitroreductase family protein [Euryarchaeota archaeon]MBT5613447.1 nitroreductase family protein [Euryarchaeota archaeon]MBT6683308.1 nitroreductase family protein [Euryarchaeota archaeon]
MKERSLSFYKMMNRRRTTRHFSNKKVERELIEVAIRTASTAPSGAHLQPWTFVVISNEELKKKIRDASEKEEIKTYSNRMPESWSELLKPLGTDYVKEHITDAPWVVVIFRQTKRQRKNLEWGPTYYSQESCGIAIGIFISAIQNMGLVTLTHTPSPMGFLREILNRPKHEHAMLLMPVGYPADDAKVPNLGRKNMSEVIKWME